MRAVYGRLERRYSYSASIVYNNFSWPALQPQGLSPQNIPVEAGYSYVKPNNHAHLEACVKAVLDTRATHTNASLADLYDPLTMPANLLKAYQALDKVVDAAYGYKGANTDAVRMAFLFERYQQLTSLLPTEKAKKAVKKSK